MIKPLRMTDSNQVYLSGPRIDPEKYPHDFFIYSQDEKNLKEVLLWVLETAGGAWVYHYIDDLSEIIHHEDPYDEVQTMMLEDRLASVSSAVYCRHLKISFAMEQDAVLFKLKWQ